MYMTLPVIGLSNQMLLAVIPSCEFFRTSSNAAFSTFKLSFPVFSYDAVSAVFTGKTTMSVSNLNTVVPTRLRSCLNIYKICI